ncbi:hypothetical protein GGF46_000205 [Coemansia sp. RSA 552]|nr:hypothetical protein GGF46_000205 [Coemansia sp. RSA 552]
MQTEVENAATFWLKYLPDSALPANKRDLLHTALIAVLCEKYQGHWDPERTSVGSAYRSLSNWRGLDSALAEAARRAAVPAELLERWLPRDLILWCDPHSVTCRVGDHGSVVPVYEDKRGLLDSVKKSVAEKASRSGSDFVISAYTTPVVMRSADGVEISRRGGASPSQAIIHASPTKGANDLRRSAMSPLRQVSSFRPGVESPTAVLPPRWTLPSS